MPHHVFRSSPTVADASWDRQTLYELLSHFQLCAEGPSFPRPLISPPLSPAASLLEHVKLEYIHEPTMSAVYSLGLPRVSQQTHESCRHVSFAGSTGNRSLSYFRACPFLRQDVFSRATPIQAITVHTKYDFNYSSCSYVGRST